MSKVSKNTQDEALQRRSFTNPQTHVIREITSSVIHCFVCQSSPLVSAPNQTTQTHTLPFFFSVVCFNALLLSTPKFAEFSLSFWFFSSLIFYSFSFSPCRASTASCSFDFITITFFEQFKLWSFPLCIFLFVSCYFFPLKEKLSPQHSISQLRSVFCCHYERPVVVPYRTRCNVVVFTFLDVRKGKGSWA